METSSPGDDLDGRAASSNTSSVNRAVVVHENKAARSGPAAVSFVRKASSDVMRTSASSIAASLDGSNSRAASPAMLASGSIFEQAVGTPAANASSTGRPKPSKFDG